MLFNLKRPIYNQNIRDYCLKSTNESIKKIIEPTLTKIIGNQIYPDTMNQDDRFITAHSGFKNVIRKFKMYVDLDIVERFAVDIYENIN